MTRVSEPEREEEEEPRTLGRQQFLTDQVIGTLVSVSWAYVLQQQIDPRGSCPGTDRQRCWGMLIVYAMNMFAGILYTPAIILYVMRLVGKMRRNAIELNSNTSCLIDLIKRFSIFATTGATMQWSISVSTTLSQLLGEIEFVVSSGHVESRSSSGYGPPRPGGDSGYRHHDDPHDRGPEPPYHDDDWRPHLRRRLDNLSGVSINQLFVLQLVNFETCALSLALFTYVMVKGNAMLKHCTTPFGIELCMLLRGSLHYASAYAVTTVITGIWFLGFDIATAVTGSKYEAPRFIWSMVKSVTVFISFRSLARAFFLPLDDEDSAIATFAHDTVACIKALSHKTLAVVACLAVFDTVQSFLNDVLNLHHFWLILGYFLYAIMVLLVAIARRSLEVKSLEDLDKENSSLRNSLLTIEEQIDSRLSPVQENEELPTYHREGPRRSSRLAVRMQTTLMSDKQFYDSFETWTCCFALWIPYELLLIQAYDLSWSVTSAREDWLSHLIRFLWQVTLGLLILAVCVALASFCGHLAAFARAWKHSLYQHYRPLPKQRSRRRSHPRGGRADNSNAEDFPHSLPPHAQSQQVQLPPSPTSRFKAHREEEQKDTRHHPQPSSSLTPDHAPTTSLTAPLIPSSCDEDE